jgi:hypothetical protein
MSSSPTWFWYVFPLFFVIIRVGMMRLIAEISGWSLLAKRFRRQRVMGEEMWIFRSARMRFRVRYGQCLNVAADTFGIYFSIFSLFRVGHAPLLIPWEEVVVQSEERGVIFKSRELLIGRQERVPFRISKSLATKIQVTAGSSWPVETIAADWPFFCSFRLPLIGTYEHCGGKSVQMHMACLPLSASAKTKL